MSKPTFLLLSAIGIGLASATPLMSCTCGQKKHQMRSGVIGGEDADKNEYPWMIALKHKDYTICGATLINSKWIITAKHCSGDLPSEYKVTMGEYDLNDQDYGKDFNVVEIVKHPYVDLALMEVKGNIDISTYTPICLPKPGFDIRGKNITLAGWGATCWEDDPLQHCNTEHKDTNILQEAVMPVPSNEVCRESNMNYFCFGGNGKSGCHGDSGSGIIHNNNGKWTLMGTTFGPTFGSQNCGIGPGDFGTGPEVSKFMDWIEENAVGGTSCKN